MQILDMPQNSPEWIEARKGIPTASNFAAIIANGRGGAASKTRAAYMRKLAGEIITGDPGESFNLPAFDRGHALEPEARDLYAFAADVEPRIVGFIRNGDMGCSPDSLIGNDGALEIKTQRADLLIETLERGEFPPEHKAQCQGVLLVAEREWIDIVIYWPRMPLFIRRAYRDDRYIAHLAAEISIFNDELAAMVDRVRKIGA